jgi:hypothetical protein
MTLSLKDFTFCMQMGGAEGVEAGEEALFTLTPGMKGLKFQCIPRHVPAI